MDLLSQHEAFLRAIFDAPDDDTPRLVYADFLQENGEEDRAEFIRVQCELANSEQWDERHNELQVREWELLDRLQPERQYWEPHERERIQHVRGFPAPASTFVVDSALLADPLAARWRTVLHEPEMFGARALAVEPEWKLHRELRLRPEHVELLLSLPVTQSISEWTLAGHVVDVATLPPRPPPPEAIEGMIRTTELLAFHALTTAALNVLAWHRGARRITVLDLRNNDLGSDAARALLKSPYLNNLRRLQLLEGNQLRGRVWQQVIERFGEDVVG